MKITWNITKKRGNWRPKLTVTVQLEEWEQDLALMSDEFQIKTGIPLPPGSWKSHCYPGEKERAAEELATQSFYTIGLRLGGSRTEWKANLPWRPGARPEYPEVEEAMHQLRDEIESLIKEAYDSEGWEAGGELGLTEETKRHVAPGVAARRMLKVVGGQDASHE